MDCKIVVLSKGRPDKILTKRSVTDKFILVVPHDECDTYKEYNKDLEVISQPKEVRGITMARQFVLDHFESVFMLDDDIDYVRKMYTEEGEPYKVTNQETILQIIAQNESLAKQCGAKMFGFTHARRPVAYNPMKPFSFTGFLNGSHTGFLKGHNLKYDPRLIEGEDHFISAYNVYKNRFMIIDNRYAFFTKDNWTSDGGCSMDRNSQNLKRDTLLLRELFGEVVHIKTGTSMKKNLIEGERTLKFPYK